MDDLPFVSVIIPLYNDSQSKVLSCLQALGSQTYPKGLYEVIIVDNGSNPGLAQVVLPFEFVRILQETSSSSYAARNKGIQAASGEVIGFTDGDCIPARDWIEKGVRRLTESEKHCLVGGRIEKTFKTLGRPNPAELFDSVTYHQQKDCVEKYGYATTANVFCHRETFQAAGLFNSSLKSAGDFEWGRRANAAGCRILYADDVVVTHPARTSLRQIKRKIARTTGGFYMVDRASVLAVVQKAPVDFFKETLCDHRLKKVAAIRQMPFLFLMIIFEHVVRLSEIRRLKKGGEPHRE